jgi:hypothetical protein
MWAKVLWSDETWVIGGAYKREICYPNEKFIKACIDNSTGRTTVAGCGGDLSLGRGRVLLWCGRMGDQ